ncbi:MAG TPA: hypothetical protein VNF07_06190 [Acidimicrobiales bacterium]|nr:hypothetical protein [Acidimicrobiales bacterium]
MASRIVSRHWFPTHQPQTLQIAVALLYWNAFLLVVGGLFLHFGPAALITLLADVAGGFGVANAKRWGYYVAVAAALFPFVILFRSLFTGGGLALNLTLIFDVALVALLVHPMSRSHVKVWFS